MKKPSSFDSKERKLYKEIADTVWFVENKFKRSHLLNEVRIPYIYSAYLTPESMSLEKLRKPIPDFYKINMLEVGCGGGICAEALAELGFNVTGIDPVPELIEVARDHIQKNIFIKYKNNLRYVNTTIEEFVKQHRNTFDAVVISDVLEHVSYANKEEFLRNCVECVKMNGKVLITTTNFSIWSLLMSKLFSLEPSFSHLPFSFLKGLTPTRLRRMLHSCGCVIMEVRGITFSPYENCFQVHGESRCWYYVHAVRQSLYLENK